MSLLNESNLPPGNYRNRMHILLNEQLFTFFLFVNIAEQEDLVRIATVCGEQLLVVINDILGIHPPNTLYKYDSNFHLF